MSSKFAAAIRAAKRNTVWLPVPEHPELELCFKRIAAFDAMLMVQRSSTRNPEAKDAKDAVEIDIAKLSAQIIPASITDWRGFTIKRIEQLIDGSIEAGDMPRDEPFPYDTDSFMEIVVQSPDFDFITFLISEATNKLVKLRKPQEGQTAVVAQVEALEDEKKTSPTTS